MKKLFGFLRKPAPIAFGISASEYNKICRKITNEYKLAESRQHPDTKGPSNYMKGLKYALDALSTVVPHDMEEA